MSPAKESTQRIELGRLLLEKYRVEHVLGEGGMGVVLGVKHTELNVLFAMKLLLQGTNESGPAVERFLKEARAAARIVSDHVAHVYDVGKLEDGSPYMLMEHLEGVDLSSLLESDGPIAACDAIDYVLQALDAIVEAHSLGIIHRDLKPANLFLAKRPTGHSTVKVLDFGISQELDRKGPSLTHSGSLIGTPYYMSPEQMRSSKEIDARSDVWALGVVLYELLTDTVPFPGASVTEVCARVLEGTPPSLLEAAPTTPARLVEIVNRCLARAPDDRFQSAESLAQALRDLRADLGDAPKALRPREALDSFTGPNIPSPERPIRVTPAEIAATGQAEDPAERATSPAPIPDSIPSPASVLPFTPSDAPPAMRSELAKSVIAPSSKRASTITMTGWSDSPPHQARSRWVLGAMFGSPLLLLAFFLSMRAIFAAAPTKANAAEAANGQSVSAATLASVSPVLASMSAEPAVSPDSSPTSSAAPSSSPRSTAKTMNSLTATAPNSSTSVPTYASSASKGPASLPRVSQPRRHEGIY